MNFNILHWFHLMFGNHTNLFCHAVIVGNYNVKKVERQSVAQAWGTLHRKSTLFKLIVKFFLKGVVFMFWHDIVYIELLYCVTNFELVWI